MTRLTLAGLAVVMLVGCGGEKFTKSV